MKSHELPNSKNKFLVLANLSALVNILVFILFVISARQESGFAAGIGRAVLSFISFIIGGILSGILMFIAMAKKERASAAYILPAITVIASIFLGLILFSE